MSDHNISVKKVGIYSRPPPFPDSFISPRKYTNRALEHSGVYKFYESEPFILILLFFVRLKAIKPILLFYREFFGTENPTVKVSAMAPGHCQTSSALSIISR